MGRSVASLMVGAVLVAATASCTSREPSTQGGEAVVVAMSQAVEGQQPGSLLDPAQFYGGEGLAITNAAYEGLVRYRTSPASSEIVPGLAVSWIVSDTGLQYTFTLRQGMLFADGTPVTSSALAESFRRFSSMGGGPSYMLDQVLSYETPDPGTLVIRLSEPVSAFMDYLASPYGPKAISPAALSEHQDEGVQAADWLATNTAGTGPYQLAEYVPNERYVLARNVRYWGPEQPLASLEYVVIPDPAARTLQLQSGEVDIALVDQPSTVSKLSGDPTLQVIQSTALKRQSIFFNQHRAPFDDATVREAAWSLLAEAGLSGVWGSAGESAAGMLPRAMGLSETPLPAPLSNTDARERLKEAAGAAHALEIVYNQGAVQDQVVAESAARALESAGLTVEIRAPGPGEAWYESNPPHMFVNTSNPDAAHPDAWARLFYHSHGFLNFLDVGDEQVDLGIDSGLSAVDVAEADAAYVTAMAALGETWTVLPVADVQSTFVANVGLDNWGVDVAAPFSLDLTRATLEEGS